MDLFFWNKKIELVGLIDTAQSIQWLERYYEVGSFEVYIQVSQDVLDIINQSYYISRNDSKYVGIIEHIENEDDIDNGNFLIIQGHFAERLINKRIIRSTRYLNDTLFNIVDTLLQENILDPVLQQSDIDLGLTISPRKMSCLNTTISNQLINNPTLETQAGFENKLLDFIIKLLKSYGASIRLEFNQDGLFDIVLYEGIDRSYNQDINPYVVFSKEFDNLISSNYKFDSQNEANVLYVGGEDNDTASEGRYIDKYELPTEDGVVSDIDRAEVFINASDLKQSWKDEDTQIEHSLSTEEYRKLLRARGKENVVAPSEELSANITMLNYEYNVDFFLGDIISIENETQGLYSNKRLIGMDIVDDENGHTLEPICEDPTIYLDETESIESVGYLLAEDGATLLTESNEYLVQETAETSTTNKKISELEEATNVSDGCCIPIVSENETKKITYGSLKDLLVSDLEIDNSTSYYVGDTEPSTSTSFWFDTTEIQTTNEEETISLMSLDVEEELTFSNEEETEEELIFNNEEETTSIEEEELTFNSSDDEELTFNNEE